MKFMAFNLTDIMAHQKDNIPKVGVRTLDASNLLEAKMLACTYEGEWTVVPVDVVDAGRIGHTESAMADLQGWIQFYNPETCSGLLQ
jgi:hypothetical protein